jgi:beta-lactamase superfamily II metal-dependent hydrolase
MVAARIFGAKGTQMRILSIARLIVLLSLPATAANNLRIYFVDVEGGAATLIVSPSGESLLADTGNPLPDDRDAKRIYAATRQAGLKKIDYLVTTHFDGDHSGGVAALVKMIPIANFYDHGDTTEAGKPRDVERWNAYKAAAATGKRVSVNPGDRIPLRGVKLDVVSSNGDVLAKAINGGGPNQLCQGARQKDPDKTENSRCLGFLLTYGKWKFLDLGDLTWDKEMALACPVNKVGEVTLLQATHHGFFGGRSGAPALVYAIRPQVVVVNNGPRKGLGTPDLYEELTGIPGIEGIWQGHLSLALDKQHNTSEDMIANLEPSDQCQGHVLTVTVEPDGAFTVTNSRNGFSKTYQAR